MHVNEGRYTNMLVLSTMVKNLQIYFSNIWNSIVFLMWNFIHLKKFHYYKNMRIIFWREQTYDSKGKPRECESLPNCHFCDVTHIQLTANFTCSFILFLILITSQFCEGGIHFISQWLVSVLIDTKFVWGEKEKSINTFQHSVSKTWRYGMDQQTFV